MASSAPNGSSISSTSASCASARASATALAHAARELVRPLLVAEVAEVHHLEQLVGARAGARRVGTPRELQRELDVAAAP